MLLKNDVKWSVWYFFSIRNELKVLIRQESCTINHLLLLPNSFEIFILV